jgi:hypothetical protein
MWPFVLAYPGGALAPVRRRIPQTRHRSYLHKPVLDFGRSPILPRPKKRASLSVVHLLAVPFETSCLRPTSIIDTDVADCAYNAGFRGSRN